MVLEGIDPTDHESVKELMLRMIRTVEAVGGVPTAGYRNLNECFTYEPSLELLMLWYNINGNTRIEFSPWCSVSETVETSAIGAAVPIYPKMADTRRSGTSDRA